MDHELSLAPGARLFSAVCDAEFIVVRAPSSAVALTIGGVPALASPDRPADRPAATEGHDGGAAVGKRFADPEAGVELLCTKPGTGVPALDGELIALKESKPLPASD